MAKKNNTAATADNSNGVASLDLNSFLATASGKPKKKGRRETPVVNGYEDLADKAHRAYKAFKDAEVEFRQAEGALYEHIAPLYEQGALNGDFSKSFNVSGDETGGVQFKWQDRFKPCSYQQGAVLLSVLSEVKLRQHYMVSRKLTAVEPSDQDIRDLIAALGEDRFKAMFKIVMGYQAKPGMDEAQFRLPVEARPEQYKASMTPKGEDSKNPGDGEDSDESEESEE